MSVLAFASVQSKVKDLIQVNAYLAAETVALHAGRALAEVEQALRDRGQAVVVYPVQSAGSAANGLGAVKMTVVVPVLFIFNPEVGTLDIYQMVSNGIGAVLDYFTPNVPQDRFRVEAVEIAESDAGTWGYLVDFSKAVQFT
jgi:hypothetical protein